MGRVIFRLSAQRTIGLGQTECLTNGLSGYRVLDYNYDPLFTIKIYFIEG